MFFFHCQKVINKRIMFLRFLLFYSFWCQRKEQRLVIFQNGTFWKMCVCERKCERTEPLGHRWNAYEYHLLVRKKFSSKNFFTYKLLWDQWERLRTWVRESGGLGAILCSKDVSGHTFSLLHVLWKKGKRERCGSETIRPFEIWRAYCKSFSKGFLLENVN